MVCFRRLFFREQLFRRVLSAPSFYVAFGTDRDIAPPSRFIESHIVSLAVIIAIRVGMAMMEVVVTIQIFQSDGSQMFLKYFRVTDLSILQSGSNLTSSLQVKPHFSNFAQNEKKNQCHVATPFFAHMTCNLPLKVTLGWTAPGGDFQEGRGISN